MAKYGILCDLGDTYNIFSPDPDHTGHYPEIKIVTYQEKKRGWIGHLLIREQCDIIRNAVAGVVAQADK